MKKITLALLILAMVGCLHDDEGCNGSPPEPTPTDEGDVIG